MYKFKYIIIMNDEIKSDNTKVYSPKLIPIQKAPEGYVYNDNGQARIVGKEGYPNLLVGEESLVNVYPEFDIISGIRGITSMAKGKTNLVKRASETSGVRNLPKNATIVDTTSTMGIRLESNDFAKNYIKNFYRKPAYKERFLNAGFSEDDYVKFLKEIDNNVDNVVIDLLADIGKDLGRFSISRDGDNISRLVLLSKKSMSKLDMESTLIHEYAHASTSNINLKGIGKNFMKDVNPEVYKVMDHNISKVIPKNSRVTGNPNIMDYYTGLYDDDIRYILISDTDKFFKLIMSKKNYFLDPQEIRARLITLAHEANRNNTTVKNLIDLGSTSKAYSELLTYFTKSLIKNMSEKILTAVPAVTLVKKTNNNK